MTSDRPADDPARARREFAAAERLGGGTEHVTSRPVLAMALTALGDRCGARRLLLVADSATSATGTYPAHSVVSLAEAWAALGDRDRALAWLGRFAQPPDLHFQLHLKHDPAFAPLRGDRLFRALVSADR